MKEQLLETLVGFESQTDNHKVVKQLIDFVSSYLEERGLKTTYLEYDGVPNLYATTSGGKSSRLLLQGHVDVVPGKQPFKNEGDRFKGRGVYDMLFGTAAFLELVDELKDDLDQYDLAILLSGDEEHGGLSGVNKVLADGYTTDVCLLPDAGNGFGSMSVGAKGVYHAAIRLKGRAHHGSRPWEGDGAANKLVDFLGELRGIFDATSKDNSTMTISVLKAGEALNQGPAEAECGIDIRYTNKQDLNRIEKSLNALLKKYDGEVIHLHTGSDFQLDTSHLDVAKFIELYEKAAGKQIEFVRAHGSSDARFFSERNIPVIMIRPDGGGAHGDDEWISKESFNEFYKLLKQYVTTIAHK